MSPKRKWLLTGGLGSSLFCFGIRGAIETGFYKHDGADLLSWVTLGTLSLITIMLGLILLIKAGGMEKTDV